eukprot:CAMPEP_0184978266 /NCGR_PEP_ID=MMETSP1098-20130426/8822_1 /TAXON_ID=89044 /ORGANISM="Spumella elongata, Strain CCAP 955/1" /LENGTH=536 /DNA_ID=CAMNT_0027501385 /DNA_START=18 /DNA_END=1628 /DNA_ORIENTATION=-
MSSFKRAVKANTTVAQASSSAEVVDDTVGDNVTVTGVKPWVNTGLGIASSGNKQLDELIGGGCALGTLTFVESDSFSNYGETLALYGLAESISHKHAVLLVSEDNIEAERLMAALPYNQTIGRAGNVSNEDHAVVPEKADANKLTIAWQYGKYIKPKDEPPVPRGSSSEIPAASYCCSYDLSRRLQSSILESATVEMCSAGALAGNNSSTSAEQALNKITQAVEEFVAKHHKSPKSVSRIVISSLDQILAAVGTNHAHALNSTAIARFVLQIKHIIRTSRVHVLMYANPGSMSVQTVAKLRQVSDTVLSVESFAGRTHSVPYEFKDFQGFLVVHKLQQYGSMAPFRPPGTRFGLKRDRRKLHIEPLHLPPEESRAFSTTGGAAPVPSAGNTGSGAVGSGSGAGDSVHLHHENSTTRSGGAPAGTSITAASAVETAAVVAASVEVTAAPVPVKLTPLQASLAALKAARISGSTSSSSTSSITSTPVVAPVSIQRPVPAVPAANIFSKPVPVAQPPLQPGQACGASKQSGSADSKYDF